MVSPELSVNVTTEATFFRRGKRDRSAIGNMGWQGTHLT